MQAFPRQPEGVCHLAEQSKLNKYTPSSTGLGVVPLAASTFGMVGGYFRDWLRLAASHYLLAAGFIGGIQELSWIKQALLIRWGAALGLALARSLCTTFDIAWGRKINPLYYNRAGSNDWFPGLGSLNRDVIADVTVPSSGGVFLDVEDLVTSLALGGKYGDDADEILVILDKE